MLWIIQKNLFTENRREDLIQALTRLNINFIMVEVNNNNITPEIPIDNTQPIITNGSIMLSNIARTRGWNPGSLFNDNFSYDIWSHHYKDMILNNGVISTIKDAKFDEDTFFVRPILDNKSFNGRVFSRQEFSKFQQDAINLQFDMPKPDTQIVISKPKTIGQEHRHYIVDGQIITSSRYKLSGQPNFHEGADENVLQVVRDAINIWQPARAFVLDTYIAGNDIGIVEIGSICHAGLYESDLIKLVNALDSMLLDEHIMNNKTDTRLF